MGFDLYIKRVHKGLNVSRDGPLRSRAHIVAQPAVVLGIQDRHQRFPTSATPKRAGTVARIDAL
jgi:hypothetical protein